MVIETLVRLNDKSIQFKSTGLGNSIYYDDLTDAIFKSNCESFLITSMSLNNNIIYLHEEEIKPSKHSDISYDVSTSSFGQACWSYKKTKILIIYVFHVIFKCYLKINKLYIINGR